MRRAVLDANIWISAAMYPQSVPGHVVDLVRTRSVQSILSLALIDQVARRLTGLGFSPVDVKTVEARMVATSLLVEPTIELTIIAAKPSDNRVLECAVAGSADWIVTGDRKHLLPLGQYDGIPILSPRDFLTALQRGTKSAPGGSPGSGFSTKGIR